MIFGAILAGGIGSRMKLADMPKQFLALGDKPIIIHTIEKFLMCNQLDRIYIGVNPNWNSYLEDLLEKYVKDTNRVVVINGGSDRNSTIFNIIEAIEQDFGKNDEHIIVTHDAVRPFVTLRIINDNIDAVKSYGACDTVVSATDTIVKSSDGKVISDIPNRDHMYQGQTPQSFKISELKDAYLQLSESDKAILSDACSIYVKLGKQVQLVQGEVSNMKITTVTDYKIAQAMIGGVPID